MEDAQRIDDDLDRFSRATTLLQPPQNASDPQTGEPALNSHATLITHADRLQCQAEALTTDSASSCTVRVSWNRTG